MGDVRESNSRSEVHSLVCDRYTNATANWSATEELNLDLPLIGRGPCRWTSGGQMVGVERFELSVSRSRTARGARFRYTPIELRDQLVSVAGFEPATSCSQGRRSLPG